MVQIGSLLKNLLLLLGLMLLLGCAVAPAFESSGAGSDVGIEVTRLVNDSEIIISGGENFPPGTELRILQWKHFVPAYDEWFDQFAQSWGEQVGVDVTVDHIDLWDLDATLARQISEGEGHTLIELVVLPSAFVEGLHDLTEVNLKAQALFGEQVNTCKASSYLPMIDSYYALCHGYVPKPGNYDIGMWTTVGYPDGPATYAELLDGGRKIKERFGIPVGIGISPELDSEMATRAVIWSFGGSIQDENENVVLYSDETIAAVEYLAELYFEAMTVDVMNWDARSNNDGLINGELSYILNSISAYRSLQKVDQGQAANIGLTSNLAGPHGDIASSHVWGIYVVPKYVEQNELDAAEAFMLHLIANYNQAVYNSEMYNFPAFPSTALELFAEDGWLVDDPFASSPPSKLSVLSDSDERVHLGYPGVANPAIGEVYRENIITEMVARVAKGQMTAEESVRQADQQVRIIFQSWREKGLVGGTP